MVSARALVFCLLCAACTTTEPVVVMAPNGQTLRGSATAELSGGTFSVADGRLTCGGTYNTWAIRRTIEMPVRCSDGRTGTAVATRDITFLAGRGRVSLNDGTQADFVFGRDAARF